MMLGKECLVMLSVEALSEPAFIFRGVSGGRVAKQRNISVTRVTLGHVDVRVLRKFIAKSENCISSSLSLPFSPKLPFITKQSNTLD